jgi:hypothetical protein
MRFHIIFSLAIIFSHSCNGLAENELKGISYRGIVSSKYKEEKNHNVNMFKVDSGKLSFKVDAFIFHGAFEYAQIGDSLIKNKGEMEITIKKKKSNFSTYATFPYK